MGAVKIKRAKVLVVAKTHSREITVPVAGVRVL
jgi:hypothetical protein